MLAIFGKPLPEANVSGAWGDPRPASVGGGHFAIDLRAKTGTPIYATHDGIVLHTDTIGSSSAGKYIVIQLGGVSTRYLHLSKVLVTEGQQVQRGQTIGLVGTTGFSSGPHLHLDVFLSPEKLATYKAWYGTPSPTYPSARRWGTQVPAEPLIPVDTYSASVTANAAKRGIRLLPTGRKAWLVAGVLVAAGYLLLR